MPRKDPRSVLEYLSRIRSLEPSYVRGEVLGSMTTEPVWYSVEAFKIFINTNINDPSLFTWTSWLERDVVKKISTLFNGRGYGLVTYGGTESNITALYALREVRRGDVVVAPKSVHVSIDKACKLMGLKLVKTSLLEDYTPDLDEICSIARKYGERVVAVVFTAGTTDLGIVEPVDKFVKQCSVDVPIHVDAAYGGLLAIFLRKHDSSIPRFDFSVENVYSITVDTHKIISPIPGSILLYRTSELEEATSFPAPYMPEGRQRTLLGTRTGGVVAAIWSILEVEGFDGLEKLALELMEKTMYLVKRLREEGFTLVKKPVLPLVAIRVENRDKVIKELWKQRLYVYPSTIPDAIRVVVGRHLTTRHIDVFVEKLKNIVRQVAEH